MWPVTSEHGEKVDHGPISESMYTVSSTHLTTGLACTLTITREYMEYVGRLPANCALTVYYLPVYPPYCDYNYGLCRLNVYCKLSLITFCLDNLLSYFHNL